MKSNDRAFERLVGAVVIAALAVLLFRQCNKQPINKTVTKYRYDTTVQTIKTVKYDTVSEIVRLPADTILNTKYDTIEVIRNYYTERVIERNWEDSSVRVMLTDTIYKNNITGSYFQYQILQPTEINTTQVMSKGIDIGTNIGLNRLDLNASYYNNRYSIGIGYNLLNKNPYLSVKYRIFAWD